MNIYKNSFHGTEFRTKKTESDLIDIARKIANGTAGLAEKRFACRMRNALCGYHGCTCGDDFGRRS
jgi:hypothetical protein